MDRAGAAWGGGRFAETPNPLASVTFFARLAAVGGCDRGPGAGSGYPLGSASGRWSRSSVSSGVHVHRYLDGEWSRETVAAGALDPWPGSGSSEVEVGRLGERDFVATIEPWHGPQVVVYREEAGSNVSP